MATLGRRTVRPSLPLYLLSDLAVDRFLSFSLLHSHDDQSFLVGALAPSGSPQYDVQAAFDTECRRFGSSSLPLHNGHLKYCDPSPVYDMNLALNLLLSCLHNDETAFWAKLSHEHQYEVTLTNVDAFRTGFIHHIFNGDCVIHRGEECKSVVTSERSPHSMAIALIDCTLEWVQKGYLTGDDFTRTCASLDLFSSAKRKVKSLTKKILARRRELVDILEAASLPVSDLFQRLGSSSSSKSINSIGNAHGIGSSKEDSKDSKTEKIIEHLTQGRCAQSDASNPGCERVVSDADLLHDDPIHLQVAVLWRVIEVASKKQTQAVLDLHEIDYSPIDTIRKLRDRMKKFIQRIERGKLRDARAEGDAVARLAKLEHIRKSWPRLIPMSVKENIVRSFRVATSSAALASFTCACCSRDMPLHQKVRKPVSDVDIELLNGPATHWNDPSFRPPPAAFDNGLLKGKLLDARGVGVEGGDMALELCCECSRSLRKHTLPKHALANKLYVGPVPDELHDLSMVEECMIARARAKSWIVKLQENDADSALPTVQRGLKGHTIIYPQQPDTLATMLPAPVGDTITFICIIFVGNSKLTKEWLREKAKPLVVRREKVRNALQWLKLHNPLYKDVEISEDNLCSLPNNDVLPYHIEHLPADEAQETLTSKYDNTTHGASPTSSTHFDSVVIADVDAHTPANQLRAAAVHHAKTKGKPFVQIGHGSNPINEFANTGLFPSLYPTLYPYGCGGFEDRTRGKLISMKDHTKYLLSLHDKRFQTHNSFLFTVFNILQRRALLLGCSLKVKRASFNLFAKSFSTVSSEAIGDVLERIEKGGTVTACSKEERRVLRLMKEVNLVTAKVPGSSASRVNMRNEIRALTMTHGMPSFYITINPADTHNPIVKFLSGENIDIDSMLEGDIPKYWEQSVLISSNPTIGAKFFNTYLKAFIRTVLGFAASESDVEEGILGVVKAHYGCVEAQGRGSLHCHMLVWIEGALNPNEIREKVLKDAGWGKTLLDYLDDTITNVIPEDPIPDVTTAWDDKDPCTLRGVNLNLHDTKERLAMRMKDINRLAEHVQRHRHSHTCYKHYRPGDARTCRFDLKEENFRAQSCIDPETGQICLRCLDGLVNNFNITILEAVRCNMDIQFIGSGESAKAMIYYITDYITKSQLKSHVAYAALQLAVKKCEDISDEEDAFTVKSKRLLQKCAYALISHQEMSAQQVASYLMDYEDHFTSHSFAPLYWASFERYVERCDDEKLFTNFENNGDNPDLDHDVPMTNETSKGQDEREIGTVDEETGGDSANEDEVAIRIDDSGNISILADQISDYTLRPRELTPMCLWDFVAKTEKVYRRKKSFTASNDRSDDDGELGGEGSVEETDLRIDDENVDQFLQKGKRSIPKFRFEPDHKESDRKEVRLRI